MRHFRSILYAIVLAAAVWVLVGAGLTHGLTARDGFAVESFTGLVLLLLGGAAYGILLFAPISPLGPTVAGLAFLGVGGWAVEWPAAYAGAWPSGAVRDGFDLSRTGYGLAPLLAVPLLLTVLSVRRWSGFEPVVLPIVGAVGRPRGAATAPGRPAAGTLSTLFPAPPADEPADDGEATTVLRAPAEPEATTVLRVPGAEPTDGEETTVLRAPGPREEAPTEDVAAAGEEPPTEDVAAAGEEPPTEDVATAGEESTDAIADERPTQAVGATVGEEPTEAIADERPTESVLEEPTASPADQEEPTEAIAETTAAAADSTIEEPTAVLILPTESTDEETDPGGFEGDEAIESAADAESAAVAESAGDAESVTDEEPATEEEPAAQTETDAVGEVGPIEPVAAVDDEAERSAETEQAVEAEPIEPVDDVADNPVPQPVDEVGDEQAAGTEDDEPATSVLVPVTDEEAPKVEAIADEPEVGNDEALAEEPTATGTAAVEPDVDDEELAEDRRVIVVDEVLVDDDEDDDEVVMVEETTYLLMPADDDERTQAIRLSAALENDGERTQVIRPIGYEPGQTTRDLGIPGERTQIIWPAANRIPGERTVEIGGPGEKTRRIVRTGPGQDRAGVPAVPAVPEKEQAGPDETQVIRSAGPDVDGERTQVIRPGRVTPPSEDLEPTVVPPSGERTEPNLPEPDRLPGDRTTARTKAGPPRSIVGAESPNFADDPTGRLVPPPSMSDEPTRTMTVMNLERPPDEVPEIPSPRKPLPEED